MCTISNDITKQAEEFINMLTSMYPIERDYEDDIDEYMDMYEDEYDTNEFYIVDVIFNPPATIVFWSDNTKTVVKAQGKGKNREKYDAEKGLAMAIVKKLSGNTGKYNDIFKKWIPEEK